MKPSTARNLPYGEQRRVEIARALARGPKLLLLDEPAAGLNHGEKTDKAVVGRRIDEVYSLLPRLAERRTRQGGLLSGGEQQMLAVGRALVAAPRLLMLDEPSVGLAPLLVAQIMGLIREINAAGTSVLLVEQNARAALKIAHRGYVVENGAITLQGTAAELARDSRVVEAYLGA